jgi:GT2 family glycosyltransferase
MEYSTEDRDYEFRGSPKDVFDFFLGAGLYRKRVFTEVGLFDPELRYSEDVDWYNRAQELGKKLRRIDAVTLFVRRHPGNMTRGRTLVELNMLRAFKKQRDRLRLTNSKAPFRQNGKVIREA